MPSLGKHITAHKPHSSPWSGHDISFSKVRFSGKLHGQTCQKQQGHAILSTPPHSILFFNPANIIPQHSRYLCYVFIYLLLGLPTFPLKNGSSKAQTFSPCSILSACGFTASIHTYYTLIQLMFLKSFLPSFVILRSGDLVLTSLRGCAQQAGEPPIVNLAVG